MSRRTGRRDETVEDALARQVETRGGPASRLAEGLRRLGRLDRAVYQAVARASTAELDDPIRRLSDAATYSRLWLGIAAAIALLGGGRGRRAALEGVVSIGVTSAAVNLGVKRLHRRPRPERVEPGPHRAGGVRMPTSTSFPSGHAASAFAFAAAVGRHLPGLAAPLGLLAGGVAYSRVHVGVHYPGDVVAGAVLGAGGAAVVATTFERLSRRRYGTSTPGCTSAHSRS